MSAHILKELIKIANKLDLYGLYEEANVLDEICKYAIQLDQTIEPWEAEMMEMDISPEAKEKEQEYAKYEIPTDPEKIEELIARTKILLKGVVPDSYTDGPQYWEPQTHLPEDRWYFETENDEQGYQK